MPTLPSPYAGVSVVGSPVIAGRRASAEDYAVAGGIAAGRELQRTAGDFLERTEQEESRKALVQSSEIRAKYARLLDEAATSGADLEKLKEQMQNDLSKVGADFQTKQGASALQLYTANTELMFDEQSNRIAVQRASAQARLDGRAFLNSESATIQSNPQYLPIAEKNAEALVSTFTKIPTWARAELGDDLKKSLNMAAAMSAARNDPAGTMKELDAGQWNLSDEQRRTARRESEHYENVKRAAEEREKARIKEERRDAADLSRDKYTQRILSGELGGKLYNEIVRDETFAHFPQYREHLATLLKAHAKALQGEEKQSNPIVMRDLYARLIAPEGTEGKLYTTDEVYNALKRGDLNVRDTQFLVGVGAAAKDENGRSFSRRLGTQLNSFEQALRNDPRTKALDAAQVAAVNMNLTAAAEQRAAELRRGADGEKPRSPDGMFDPNSKDFFFTPQRLRDTISAVKSQGRAAQQVMEKGTKIVRDGFEWEFQGGDPAQEKSWKKGVPVTESGKIR